MDYIIQMENLYKFFSLSLNAQNMQTMLKIKRKFNNDLNLLGCFIKDFLILENGSEKVNDNNLYNDFVIYYEKNLVNLEEVLKKLDNYSTYYLSIVFENIKNMEIIGYIETINACFALDTYPLIMKLFDDYYNQKVDEKRLKNVLKSLTDIVIDRIEDSSKYNINLFEELKVERLAS